MSNEEKPVSGEEQARVDEVQAMGRKALAEAVPTRSALDRLETVVAQHKKWKQQTVALDLQLLEAAMAEVQELVTLSEEAQDSYDEDIQRVEAQLRIAVEAMQAAVRGGDPADLVPAISASANLLPPAAEE